MKKYKLKKSEKNNICNRISEELLSELNNYQEAKNENDPILFDIIGKVDELVEKYDSNNCQNNKVDNKLKKIFFG